MKKNYLNWLFLFLISPLIYAQTTAVSSLVNPSRIAIDGTTLYTTNYDNEAIGTGTVSVANIATIPTTSSNIVTGLTGPYGLYINGNDLYIIDYNNIYVKDLTAGVQNVADLTIITAVADGADLTYKDGYLYYTQYSLGGAPGVYRVLIGGGTPELIVNGVSGPTGIVFDNDILYISCYDTHAIYKVDISGYTVGSPITATSGNIIANSGIVQADGLYLDGDILYISAYSGVSSIDVTEIAPITPMIVVAGPTGNPAAADVELVGDYLYIANINANNITQFDLNTASVSDFETFKLSMYPNPTNDFIKITGLTTEQHYIITNVLGENVQSGEVSQNENINVKNLQNGVYFVKLTNGATLKLLKN
jgi:hypothetical protein